MFAQKCNVKTGGINMSLAKYLSDDAFQKYPTDEYMLDSDIIVNSTGNGTLGRIGIFHDSDRISNGEIVPDSHVTIVRTVAEVNTSFVYYTLKYYQPFLEKQGDGSTNQTELKPVTIASLLIPLPPIEEQNRVVSKLGVAIPHIKSYDIKNDAITELNKMFPEQLKKSILQEAVQGKLVPQDPSDEPASILLERIREEKARLIKDGKIKKDKNESVIFRRDNSYYEKSNGVERCINAELPFEIPDSWCWARLKQLGITQTGNTPSKNHKEYFGDYIPFIGPGNISEHGIISSDKGLSLQGLEFGRLVKAGSILQVCIGGSIGKAAINQVDVTFNQQINSITPIACCKEYLFCAITAPYFIKIIKERAGGTATPIINRGEWDNILIPLAPLKEQNKIVATVKSATNFLRF